jgi:hypothetical protein
VLASGITRCSFDRADRSLTGNAALQLRFHFVCAPFLERIGATSRKQENREQ